MASDISPLDAGLRTSRRDSDTNALHRLRLPLAQKLRRITTRKCITPSRNAGRFGIWEILTNVSCVDTVLLTQAGGERFYTANGS